MARDSTKRQEKTVGRSFGDLQSLLQNAPAKPPPAAAKVRGFIIHPDDDATDVIWKIMSDGKGRTPKDVQVLFNTEQIFTIDEIEWALAYFHLSGCMTMTKVSNTPIYTLKGNAMPPVIRNQKLKNVEKKDATAQGLTVEPTLIEKIDIALWNLMSDRAWRTVNEMCRAIVGPGLTRQNSRTRLETHYRGSWFERRGSAGDTTYRMRPNIPYPTPKSLGSSAPAEQEQTALFNQEEVVTPAPVIDNTVRHIAKPTVTSSAAVRVPEQKRTLIQDPTLEDGLSTSIWKVMADYKEYTAHELAALLEHVGIPYAPILNRLSALHLHSKWFTRKHVGEGRSRCFAYTLLLDIECPVGETTYMGEARRELIRLEKLRIKNEARVGVREHLRPVDNTPPAVGAAMEAAGIAPVVQEEVKVATIPTVNAVAASIVIAQPVPVPAAVPLVDHQKQMSDKIRNLMAITAPVIGGTIGALNTGDTTATIITDRMQSHAGVNDALRIRADKAKKIEQAEEEKQRRLQQTQQKHIPKHIPAPAPQVTKPKEENTMHETFTGPIVQIKVDIKGIAFTLPEAEGLMTDILRLGYNSPATIKDTSSSLIQQSISIKGIPFTPHDLCDVYRGLHAAGVGKTIKQ